MDNIGVNVIIVIILNLLMIGFFFLICVVIVMFIDKINVEYIGFVVILLLLKVIVKKILFIFCFKINVSLYFGIKK